MQFAKLLPVLAATFTSLVPINESASAVIIKGSFTDPLIPSLYPGSTLTGNFSFDSASIDPQGLVSFNNISFNALRTLINVSGFNGTGWSFSSFYPFVFNTKINLFEGVYELNRSCLPGEGCPPGTLGQSISNPNAVFWDTAPEQVVTIQSVPEPLTIFGSLTVFGFGIYLKKNIKTKKVRSA
ncbi:PEP-CTERM sorting domain-containing protein [Tolypothrix sp. FACHB-123]|uniref:PEP-CTERM sorting domain-containing protein n=1 Tax=Tolypothrix sp. FACHB-123 TaxID=2692868 RepID=UPI0016829E1D|nr:PEP-CTERM sorting domain-containing protein [Tolypothrix sp. FACHB-123]MBD2357625.1 PEP-CTERM sorting domain-containing protein [Tolypothrix sp. FACHB-123]